MKRYSPTTTENWMKCPLYRHLKKEWQPRRIGQRELAAILGGAFHAGMMIHNSGKKEGIPSNIQMCQDAAIQSIRMRIDELLGAGAYILPSDQPQMDAMEPRVTKAISQYIENDPLPPGWKILDVERILPDWGNCIIDLACEAPFGTVVIDYKTKLNYKEQYRDRDLMRYRLGEQRAHYSVAYGDYQQKRVHTFLICLVVFQPFHIYWEPFVNSDEYLANWRKSREGGTWKVMEMEDNDQLVVAMSSKHIDEEYGFKPCEMLEECFDHNRDPNLMQRNWIKKAAK